MDNNDKSEIVLFVLGIIVGVFLAVILILPMFGFSPRQIEKEIHQEAINLGHGRWTIVGTNNAEYPTVRFQWITNN